MGAESELGVGVSEFRVRGGEDEIAVKRHLEGAGKTGAMHLGDDRAAGCAEGEIGLACGLVEKVADFPRRGLDALKDLEVDARRKRPACALQNDHRERRIFFALFDQALDFVKHFRPEGVQRLRPIEAEGEDALLGFGFDESGLGLVGHGRVLAGS